MISRSRISFLMLLMVILFLLGTIVFRSFSQAPADFSSVVISSDTNILKFFDRKTGTIYVYDEISGRLRRMWVVEELGRSLRKASPVY